MTKKWLLVAGAGAVLALSVAACGGDDNAEGSANGEGEELSGSIVIDGSSTVAPLSEPIGVMFADEHPGVDVSVGTSGTGGGFEKFCNGETDLSDASRVISPEEEDACAENGVEWEQVSVANDALSVVVHPENPVSCLTVDQLSAIYSPDSTITSWSEIEGLEDAPDADLEIFSPGSDSGTFDYFTEAINGEEGAQRTRGVNIVGEDDNATVTGVSGSEGGVGYFGFSFFNENQDQLKALEIENPETGECVAPGEETTQSGDYAPLGRQLYIYPSAESLARPEMQEFMSFYIENVNAVAPQAGFIPLTDEQIAEAQAQVEALAGGGSGEEGAE